MKIKIPHISQKRLALLLILIIILSVVAVIAVKQNKGDESPEPVSGPISNKNLCDTLISTADARQALDPLNPKRVQFLEPLVEKIRQTKGFEQDVDCLYPLVTYYATTANSAEAENFLGKLEQVHAQNGKKASLYVEEGDGTIQRFKTQLEQLDALKTNFEESKTYFN